MRAIVAGFAAIAALKVWTHDRTYQAAMGDAILQAYRERAERACQREFSKNLNLGVGASTLFRGEAVVGNPGTNVAFWDYDNALWNVRFRHVHVVLTAERNPRQSCAFDVASGVASVTQQ